MSDVVLTPIYNGTTYKYHECSECKSQLHFEEDILVPLYFKEADKVRFCPYCGNQIIRISEPKYEVEPNWKWMEKFSKILDKADREIEYEIFCKMNRNQQRELIDKCDFGKEYFESSLFWNDNRMVCEIVNSIAHRNPHYSWLNKLKKEFDKE